MMAKKKVYGRGDREPIPERRSRIGVSLRLNGMTVQMSLGEYSDGRLSEVWLDAAKEGAFSRGILNALARIISTGLQHGVPVEAIVKALKDAKFEPASEEFSSASDAIAKTMEQLYVRSV